MRVSLASRGLRRAGIAEQRKKAQIYCHNVLRQSNKGFILRTESGEGPTPREGGRLCMAPEWRAERFRCIWR